MKIWNFETTLARNLDAGGGAAAAADPVAGGGSAPPSGNAPAAGSPSAPAAGAAAAPPPASLIDAARNLAQPPAPVNGQQPPADGAAYVPEGLPETLRGKTDRETIDKLAAELGKLPKPPAAAKDYKFEPPADFAAKYGDMKDDPVMPIYREIAHKHGLSNAQFQSLVVDLQAGMEKAGLLPEKPDFAADVALLAPKGGDPLENNRRAFERINNISNFIAGLQTRGQISKAEAADLAVMYSSAPAVMAFEKVLAMIPQSQGPQGGGSAAGQQFTDHEKAVRSLYPTMFKN